MISDSVSPKCPMCRAAKAIPYVYGVLSRDRIVEGQHGDFIIGGCVAWPGQPAFRCRECQAEFTKKGRQAVTFEDVRRRHQEDSKTPTTWRRAAM